MPGNLLQVPNLLRRANLLEPTNGPNGSSNLLQSANLLAPSVITTFSISGSISGLGGAGATVTLSGTSSGTTTADGSGNYAFSGLVNGPYDITPSNTGYIFTPTNLSETISGSSITGADFVSAAMPVAVALIANTGAATNSSFAGTITTDAIDTTGADFLVVVVSNYGTPTPATLLDSKANIWQPLGRYADYSCPQIFYCYNPTVGILHTFTATQVGADIAIAVGAFSGLNTTSSVFEPGTDIQSPVNEATTSVQAGSITPANVGDLIIAGFGGLNPTGPDTIDSSFTITDSPGFGHFAAGALAYFIVTAPGAVNPTWTIAANNNRIAATVAAFAHE